MKGRKKGGEEFNFPSPFARHMHARNREKEAGQRVEEEERWGRKRRER